MTFRRLLLPALGLLLGIAALLAASRGSAADSAQPAPFHRAEWIVRHLDRVAFSGGVLPSPELPIDLGPRSFPFLAPIDHRSTRPRRVNRDLLGEQTVEQPGTQAEPYLDVDPFDPEHIVAGWQENRYSDGGAQSLNVAVSFDRGGHWTESLVPELTLASNGEWERASDPWVEFGPAGTVYFASLLFNQSSPENAVGVSRSTDGGLTWEPPVEVFRAPLDFNDKQALTVDTFPDSPYYGRVYVAWDINQTDAAGQSFVAQKLVVARSRPHAAHAYKKPRRVRRGPTNIGAVPRVGPDGTVYVVWASQSSGTDPLGVYVSRSTNGGRRWSGPRRIADLRATGIANIRAGAILPSFTIDPVSGDLFVVWQDSRWTGLDQTTMTISRDGGFSWSEPVQVSAAPDDVPTFTGSVAANALGEVAVSYFSLENDPARAFLVDRYVRVSDDGGLTFGSPIRVTRKTFDIRLAAQAGGFFLGDYAGLDGGAGPFHSLWVSTRRHRQPDVFSSRTR